MTDTPRAYRSPLREAQSQETRTRILDAALDLMAKAASDTDLTIEAIARAAAVERRTVFRHFESRDALLAEAFQRLGERLGVPTEPATRDALLHGPRAAFAVFDAHDGTIRTALHSPAGRAMRLQSVARRQAAFAAALDRDLAHLPGPVRAQVEAVAHLLFSASAWEVMKDYGGLSGAQAGQAAAWALQAMLSAVARGELPADEPTLTKD